MEMLDLAHDSSPTISSVSTSDLDTESTGSFFHDRSITLGTLMGVAFPSIALHPPSRREIRPEPTAGVGVGGRWSRGRNQQPAARLEDRRRRRRRWWRLCRDDAARSASLGEFLAVERQYGDSAFFEAAADLEGMVAPPQRSGNERILFADGRVLPPPRAEEGPSAASGAFSKFPVSLSGVCCRGGG